MSNSLSYEAKHFGPPPFIPTRRQNNNGSLATLISEGCKYFPAQLFLDSNVKIVEPHLILLHKLANLDLRNLPQALN